MKILAFTLVEREYAIEVKNVVRVIRMKEITPIPQTPDFVEGVILWHGRAIPLINLCKKFGLENQGVNHKQDRILVTRFHRYPLGILVDQVTDVLRLEAENLEPPGNLLQEAHYLMGIGKIGKRLILLMDVEKLFSLLERSRIEEVQAEIGKERKLQREKEITVIETDHFQIEEEAAKDVFRVLAFSLNKENYCIEITEAKEVFTPGIVTRVLNAPSFVKGVTHLHGAIIPLIDIRPFLGLTGGDVTETSRVIVKEMKDGLVGIGVDKILGVRKIEKDSVQPPLATLQGKLLELTLGQVESESGIMAFLDLKKILELEEFKNTKEVE
jgi:purine-binding chemotaxis protein CheW